MRGEGEAVRREESAAPEVLSEARPFAIPGATQRPWVRPGGRTHRVMLWQSPGPAPETGYPIVYVLDANAVFGTVVEAVRLQTRGPHRLADGAVVVGIGYETDEPFDSEGRFRDYTVRAEPSELPPRGDGSPWPATGGVDEFLAWLENELTPAIERETSADPRRRTLIGHSLGGLFALHALFSGRGDYRVYAAGSPSIWWKDRHILGAAKRWTEERRSVEAGGTDHVRLLLGVGGRERPHLIEDARRLHEWLTAEAPPGLSAEYRCYPEESHLSVLLPFLAQAVRAALSQ